MPFIIGIRREDKNRWERRTPLIPEHTRLLTSGDQIQFVIQPSSIRVFPEEDYSNSGAEISESLDSCNMITAVKEVPKELLLANKVYMFFSHTIKAQSYNMPMLRQLLKLKCTLIDYELIVNNENKRLVFFGNFAGLAGMIDSFWALGQRLKLEGIDNPFSRITPAHQYPDLVSAKKAIAGVGEEIKIHGLPEILHPMVVGFAGYGNVSRGAQEIFNLMPHKTLSPEDLRRDVFSELNNRKILYNVVFKEKDMVVNNTAEHSFDLQDYYNLPEKYSSVFNKYLPFLSILMNCVYWTPKYPRLVTKDNLSGMYNADALPKLRVIGDISSDINGSIECTLKCTTPDNPVFVYDVNQDKAIDGFKGHGPVIMAVDHLPCELAKESSMFFSNSLLPFIPDIAAADFSQPFENLDLRPEIKNALIAHQGKLTPRFTFLENFLR